MHVACCSALFLTEQAYLHLEQMPMYFLCCEKSKHNQSRSSKKIALNGVMHLEKGEFLPVGFLAFSMHLA